MTTVPNVHECTLPALHADGDEPAPQSIRATQAALVTYLANAGQIHNPGPGYAGAVLSPAAYINLIQAFPGVNGPYVPPARPPAQPVIPAGATAAQIAEANRAHRDQTEKHQHFLETLAMAKAAYLRAASDEFFEELHVEGLAYATRTLRELVEHIRDEYDEFDADVRKDLNAELAQPWDGKKITTVIAKINNIAAIFATHGQALTEAQKCDALHNAVQAHGTLNKECAKWTRRPPADQTWPNAMSHFKGAYKTFKKTATAQSGGYANLATATAVNGAAVAAIERANELQANYAKVQGAVEQRLAALERTAKPGSQPVRLNVKYCYSCGLAFHNGADCENKKDGHKDEATGAKRLGGSTKIHRNLRHLGIKFAKDDE